MGDCTSIEENGADEFIDQNEKREKMIAKLNLWLEKVGNKGWFGFQLDSNNIIVPMRFKNFKFDMHNMKLFAKGYDLDGVFSMTGSFDLYYNRFSLSKKYSNVEIAKTEMIGTLKETTITGMYMKPRDNGLFKFFTIDPSKYSWICNLKYQNQSFEMYFNLTFYGDGERTLCSGSGIDSLSYFMLEGEVSLDNSIILYKTVNNDKSNANKLKFLGRIDLTNKNIIGKAVYLNSLVRSVRVSYEIDFEMKINVDRFKGFNVHLEAMREQLKVMQCPICLFDLIEQGVKNDIAISPCHELHAFHSDCILEAIRYDTRCPNCRLQISEEFLEYIEI